jgi:hypothetical protein
MVLCTWSFPGSYSSSTVIGTQFVGVLIFILPAYCSTEDFCSDCWALRLYPGGASCCVISLPADQATFIGIFKTRFRDGLLVRQ